MENNNKQRGGNAYSTPSMKIIAIEIERGFAESNFGAEGDPGRDPNASDFGDF